MSIPASPGREVCLEAAPQVDIKPLVGYCLVAMGVLGESAPPASCLGVPVGAGARSPPEFLESQWPNPKREFLSFFH